MHQISPPGHIVTLTNLTKGFFLTHSYFSPEAFIPTIASVPNKFDKNFLQKQQDLINSLGVTVNTGNAKVQTYLKGVKDRVDAAVASNAGLEAAFDIQEALVHGGFAEVKSALASLSS